MARVVLVALVGGPNIDIIPHFIKYYKDIGVDEFYISVNIVEERYKDLNKVISIFKEAGIKPFNIWIGTYNLFLKKSFQDYAKMKCIDSDWILRADQDEFCNFEMGLKNVVDECEKNGYTYVEGSRFERMTVDGSLPSIDRECNIFDLFPVKCAIRNGYGYGEGYQKKELMSMDLVFILYLETFL